MIYREFLKEERGKINERDKRSRYPGRKTSNYYKPYLESLKVKTLRLSERHPNRKRNTSVHRKVTEVLSPSENYRKTLRRCDS